MAKKNAAEVLVNGKAYTITGYESTAYLHKVATYLNEMEEQVSQTEGYRRLSSDEKQLMKNMNLADAYFKASDARDRLERETEQKEQEIYDLKHDLIDAQMEKEKLEKRIQELEAQKQELETRKQELEMQNRALEVQMEDRKKRQERLQRMASARKTSKPEHRL